MMKYLIAAIVALPTAAFAEQVSFICKTIDTEEIIDVVAKNGTGNEVLVQFHGGKFFDGFASFDKPVLKIVVPFDNGAGLLFFNVMNGKGGLSMSVAKDRQIHEIVCVFRD